MSSTIYKVRDNFNSFHPLTKLIFDILLTFLFFLVSFGVGAVILAKLFNISVAELLGNSGLDGKIEILRSTQILYTLTLFMIPALFIAFFYNKKPFKYLKLTKSAVPTNYLNVFLVIIFSYPIVNALASLNGAINFPAGLEAMFHDMETKAKLVTEKILYVDTIGLLMFNLVMVALLPAIGEELLFRGIFQKHFIQLTKNEHIGILLTAIFFSAIHFQFLTFLPRVFLGIILGYLFVWSKSLWLPVVAHFINNAIAVLIVYYSHVNNLTLEQDIEKIGTDAKTFIAAIASLALLSFTLFLIKRCEDKRINSL